MHRKTKSTTRILYLILLFTAILALLSPLHAFADSPSPLTEAAESTEAPAEKGDVPAEEKPPQSTTAGTDATQKTDAAYGNEEQQPTGAQTKEKSFFDSVFAAFEENLSKILSAATFIGSLLIMFCYKRGLLPLVKDGLGALASGVRTISEKTNELNIEATDITDKINGRLECAEKLLLSMEDSVSSLTSKLDALDAERDQRKRLTAVMTAEVDMLYEIFMAAALPQYLKDSVGERIAKMKAEISGGDNPNEEN